MFKYDFPRPSATATVLLFSVGKIIEVLVGKRSALTQAYPNAYCFPGGFLEAKSDTHPGETLEQTAIREVFEETSLIINVNDLHQYWTCSDPNVDPRAHVINTCFWALIPPDQKCLAKAGDDLQSVEWMSIPATDGIEFAFNHQEILTKGLYHYYRNMIYPMNIR